MTFLLIAHCSGRACRPCSGCPGSWSGSSWAEAGPRDGNQRAGAQDALLAEIRSQRIRRGDAARQHLDREAREWRVRAKRDHAEQQEELPREVRRDSTATVVATGSSREGKRLLVNGVGITNLTPITKMMVHLPNAFLPRPPQTGLVICFGMGTTHLSMLSWGIHSTAVELVPSVPGLVTFFHPKAAPWMNSPLSHVVIDDGRFYLERSSEIYDVITIDPPPPVEAAGSSLLYSKEFYSTARKHLSPDGILQQWIPRGDSVVLASVTRALTESFRYVRAFHSLEGWGIHFLASMTPIPNLSASQLAKKLPPDAARDLMEWGPASSAQEQFEMVLSKEVSPDALIREAPNAPALQDDSPVNEYFALRRLRDPAFQRVALRRLLGRSENL